MEESARKLEELKARRKLDPALGKPLTGVDEPDQTPLGDRNSVQYRSLDTETMTGRERTRVATTRDSSISMSTPHLVERERRLRMDEQGLILPLEDGSTEDVVKQKQERRSRRDMSTDERMITKTIRSDEYGRELSPTSGTAYSAFQQSDVSADTRGKTVYSVRSRARSASPSTRHTGDFRRDVIGEAEHRSQSSDSTRREMSPPSRQFIDHTRTEQLQQQAAQTFPYASPSSKESREQFELGRITNQPGLDPGEYYPVLPREKVETLRQGRLPSAKDHLQDQMDSRYARQDQMDARVASTRDRHVMSDEDVAAERTRVSCLNGLSLMCTQSEILQMNVHASYVV